MEINVKAKRQLREENRSKKQIRHQKQRREFKCFWTWPFGHAYKQREKSFRYDYVCVGCWKVIN